MKKGVHMFVVALIAFGLIISGCSASKVRSKKYTTPIYTININGNECVLASDVINHTSKSSNEMNVVVHPHFSSLAEMRQSIITGSITEEELEGILMTAPQNADGSVNICNVDQLYECIIPTDLQIEYIVWAGNEYDYLLSGETAYGTIYCGDAATYFDRLSDEYTNYSENHTATLTAKETVDDRSAVVYYYTTAAGTKMKHICYEIRSERQSILVREEYILEANNTPLRTSATIPQGIMLWISDDSGYCYGSLRGFEIRPSVEWLSQFGVREYIENYAV